MSEETQSVAEVSALPLDAILGSGEPGFTPFTETPSQESDTAPAPSAEPQEASNDDDGGPTVSLRALHRERERRQKMDARVRELEDEIQRYHEQKWGAEDQQSEQPAPVVDEAQEQEQRAFAYHQSFASFVSKHGRETVTALDNALGSLSPQQKLHVLELASKGDGDPVERVHQYVQQLGLLQKEPAFAPTSIQDALSGKKDTPQQPANQDQVLASIEQRERTIAAAERATTFNASRAEFVSEFGKASFDAVDAATKSLLESGNPVAAEFASIVTRHANPVAAAADLLQQLGLWSPQQQPAAQTAQQVMPSNFTSIRNVGNRKGPAFTGPTPLADIFAR